MAVQPAAAATLLRTTAPALRLPPVVQAQMERLFGTSFSDVRVHVGPQASAIGALAFTLGSELYFATGQYEPHSPAGQRLLAHELTHVVQQRAGRVRNPSGTGLAVVQDAGLEAEAERMGIRASAVQPARVRLPTAPPRLAAGPSPATVQRSSAPDPFARAMTRGHQEELKDQAESGMDLESVVHGKRLSKPVKKFLKPKYDTREDVHGTAGDYSVYRSGNYVDFSAYAIVSTTISYTGTRTDDFKAADSKVSVVRSAGTQVWHHVEDYDDDTNVGTMQLLLRDLHDRVRHYGGVHIYKQGKRYTAGEYGGKDDDP
jgi:hypothetical protein